MRGAAKRWQTVRGGACRRSTSCWRMRPDVVIVAATHDALAEQRLRALRARRARARREARGHRGRRRRPDRRGRRGGGAAGQGRLQPPLPSGDRARRSRRRSRAVRGDLHVRAALRPRRPPRLRERMAREPRACPEAASHRPGHAPARPEPLAARVATAAQRTAAHAFWDGRWRTTPSILLGERDTGPWTIFHVSWTEWKNLFSLEIYCRDAKLQVDGLGGSYGPQRLVDLPDAARARRPDLEVLDFPPDDASWAREWRAFAEAVAADETGRSRATSGRPGTVGAASRRRTSRRAGEEPMAERALLLDRDPGVQRGGERASRVRAARRRARAARRRLRDHLQRRPVDRPHRGA